MAHLDWRPIVNLSGFARAVEIPVIPPKEDRTKPVDLGALRISLKGISKPENKALIQNLLEGKALVPPPAKRAKDQPSRYVAWLKTTSLVSLHAQESDATEALLSLLKPSWYAECTEDANCTEWSTVEQLLESARAGAPQYKAKREAERTATVDMFKTLLKERFPNSVEWDPGSTADEEPEEQTDGSDYVSAEEQAGFDPEDLRKRAVDWEAILQVEVDKAGTPRVLNTFPNLQLVLTHSPPWRGMFRRNKLSDTIEVHRQPLLRPGESPRPLNEDSDVAATKTLLGLDKDFCLKPSWEDLFRAILYSANVHDYDPLMDYLNGITWDGVPRMGSLFGHYMCAVTKDYDGKDFSPLLRTFSTKWMLSAVARGLDPGCKVDTMVHLEGPQGKNKSKALRILGGEFFASMQVDLANKDSFMLASTRWIIELAELNQFKRAEATLQKSFISQESDTYRKPYARLLVTTDRRGTFVGTTNEISYLSDPTGNRRHWIVRIGASILTAELRRDRDQLWAEAVHLYKEADDCATCKRDEERCEAHRWWLNEEDSAAAEEQADQSSFTDSMDEKVTAFYLSRAPEVRKKQLTIGQFAHIALDEANPDKGLQMRIADSFRRLGFAKTQKRVDGHKAVWWEPPRGLMEAPKRHHADSIEDVADRISNSKPEAKA